MAAIRDVAAVAVAATEWGYSKMIEWAFARVAMVLLVIAVGMAQAIATEDSEKHAFDVHVVVEGLAHPWGLAFLPDGRLLITERVGRLRVVEGGRLQADAIAGLPAVAQQGQGGLMDVLLHPAFEQNQVLFLSYTARGDGGYGTEVARARLIDDRLEDLEVIFRALPKSRGGRHFGSRLVFLADGSLLITLGDRGHRPNGQNLASHTGSVIRVNEDGTVPGDNPYVGLDGVRPEIYTHGNRNVQGLAIDRETGTVWANEHGPQGGDEVNVLKSGTNYGWADITYGRNYGTGTRIGKGERRDGIAEPAHQWTPSIAPSGMAFYDADAFPEWRGNLFVGSLKFRMLSRLEVENDVVIHEERLLANKLGRIRDVRQGSDGFIYLLTDAPNGLLVRLEPAE